MAHLTAEQSAAIARWLTEACPPLAAEAILTKGEPIWKIRIRLTPNHWMFLGRDRGGWRRPDVWKYTIYDSAGGYQDQGPFNVEWSDDEPYVTAALLAHRLSEFYEVCLRNTALPPSFKRAAEKNLPIILDRYIAVLRGDNPLPPATRQGG